MPVKKTTTKKSAVKKAVINADKSSTRKPVAKSTFAAARKTPSVIVETKKSLPKSNKKTSKLVTATFVLVLINTLVLACMIISHAL
jgi:hypothetical protein